jgi:cytochrome c oxidase subunit 2
MSNRRLISICFLILIVIIAGTVTSCKRADNKSAAPSNPTVQTVQSNGQRIYISALDSSGNSIQFTDGTAWFKSSGGSCITCHGANGKGGIKVPDTHETSPPITYHALSKQFSPPYNDALVERAITKGLDSEDKPLDKVMPRWKMSDKDLNDLIGYLKTLDTSP